ncbi:MAG: hypothetical protein PUA74_09475 [Clostridiales bacterium]|nr:hypothetical protein [Clostridiales bacterium]
MTHICKKSTVGRKIFFLLLVSLLILTVVAAPLDIAALAGHECRCTCGGFGFHCICGNYCPVCNFIICAAELIKTLSFCAAILCVTSAIHMAILRAAAAESGPEAVYSLVSLKVKLSD